MSSADGTRTPRAAPPSSRGRPSFLGDRLKGTVDTRCPRELTPGYRALRSQTTSPDSKGHSHGHPHSPQSASKPSLCDECGGHTPDTGDSVDTVLGFTELTS